VIVSSNSTLSPTPNHVSKKGFTLWQGLLIATFLLTVLIDGVYCIKMDDYNKEYEHVYDELKQGIEYIQQFIDMFDIDRIANPTVHDHILSIISNAVNHNQPMPNLTSCLNALIRQRIMTWTVSSYRAFSSTLVSMYQRAKFWIMGQVKGQQWVIEQQNRELTNQVKDVLAERINLKTDTHTLAILIIEMKQRDLIGSLSEDEIKEAFDRFSPYVKWYAEQAELPEYRRSLLVDFVKAIKALNKIHCLSSYTTFNILIQRLGINFREDNFK
jgi:hypothetical protein